MIFCWRKHHLISGGSQLRETFIYPPCNFSRKGERLEYVTSISKLSLSHTLILKGFVQNYHDSPAQKNHEQEKTLKKCWKFWKMIFSTFSKYSPGHPCANFLYQVGWQNPPFPDEKILHFQGETSITYIYI